MFNLRESCMLIEISREQISSVCCCFAQTVRGLGGEEQRAVSGSVVRAGDVRREAPLKPL